MKTEGVNILIIFEDRSYKSYTELSEAYGIPYDTLHLQEDFIKTGL